MKNILITNPNNHTLINTVYCLRKGFYCKLIGIDKKDNDISKHVLDYSYVNNGGDSAYLDEIKLICRKHNIDIIIPHSTKDRLLLLKAENFFKEKKIPILSSSSESIMLCENKIKFIEACKKAGVPVPEQYEVRTASELKLKAKKLGYPKNKIIVKPVVSKGSRGFRIINEKTNMKTTFYKDNTGDTEMTLKGLLDILEDEFTPLIVSEFLPGMEYSVDCMKHDNIFIAIPRKRLKTKMGLTTKGKLDHNKKIIEYSKRITETVGLTSVFGFQFIEDVNGEFKVIECNPRIQGTMIMSALAGANIIQLSLKHMMGKKIKEPEIDWDLEFVRVWSGIGVGDKKKVVDIELR